MQIIVKTFTGWAIGSSGCSSNLILGVKILRFCLIFIIFDINYYFFFTDSYEAAEPGTHVLDGKTLKLPPILLGTYGNDPNKKTILVYGHYDVQPVGNLFLSK